MAGSTHLHAQDQLVFVVDNVYDYQVVLVHLAFVNLLTFLRDVPLHTLHWQCIAPSFFWHTVGLTNIYVIDLHV